METFFTYHGTGTLEITELLKGSSKDLKSVDVLFTRIDLAKASMLEKGSFKAGRGIWLLRHIEPIAAKDSVEYSNSSGPRQGTLAFTINGASYKTAGVCLPLEYLDEARRLLEGREAVSAARDKAP